MEEKNTNVSQTKENPEQNSPEISAESESTTEAAKDGVKTAVPKSVSYTHLTLPTIA